MGKIHSNMNSGGPLARACRWLTVVGGLALVLMTLWTVTDVITRYVLSKPLSGSIDLVESMLVLVVFLALPECLQRDEQITVDVVDHVVGERAVGGLKLFSALATMVFLIILGYTGLQPLMDAWKFDDRKPDLAVPIYLLLATIELAIAVSVTVLAGKFIDQLRRVFQRDGV
jgi:TRAP-type C4-dicarboxylate transport system permease small subunit